MNDSNLNSPSHQESPFKGKTGIKRLMNAFGYSLDGFKAAFKHEDAFRQEVFLACLLIPLALYLTGEPVQRALMIGSVFLVLIVELLNSAVEAVVDRVSIERHELAKRAKDIGSAAVFIALLNTVVIWGLVLFG
ncbi:MAG: diacylglycerol kinase [Methylophilus sp.]|nr:diacylglycerol kinase [Methylophilus sp.]